VDRRRTALRRLGALSAAIAAALAVSPVAEADVRTFAPVADAWVTSDAPGSNYGTEGRLRNKTADPHKRSYLRFRVTGLKTAVTNAYLEVWTYDTRARGLRAHEVEPVHWYERRITYQNAPGIEAPPAGWSGPVERGAWARMPVMKVVNGNGLVDVAVTTRSRERIRVASRENSHPPRLVVITDDEPPPPDEEPPSAPGDLSVDDVTGTSVSLSWSASTDNEGVTGYRVYVNDGIPVSTSGTSWVAAGLECGTQCTFDVTAVDAADNESEAATVTAWTDDCPDDEAPSAPTGLAVTDTTQTSVSSRGRPRPTTSGSRATGSRTWTANWPRRPQRLSRRRG
jgi:fibronectin type III domain protein